MSQHTAPQDARTWIDGDAYRADAGTGMPTIPHWDPDKVTTTGEKEVIWDPYGGIEAGVVFTPEQASTDLTIWNHRKSVYDSFDDVRKDKSSFIAVDNNNATVKTRLRGGRIVKKNGLYIEEMGDYEEFALLYIFRRGTKGRGIYCPRNCLSKPAAPGRFSGKELDGYEFEIKHLELPQPFTFDLPDGVDFDDEDGDTSGA